MDSASYGRLLRECGLSKSLSKGMEIHKKLAESGVDKDTYLGNNLIQMYGNCGCVGKAREIFDKLIDRNVYSWTIMLSAYAQNGHYMEALVLSYQMDLEGIRPNSVTFLWILGACSNLGDVETGRKIHARMVFLGWDTDTVVSTAILGMYSKCEKLGDAKKIFDSLRRKDVVSWTAIITAFSQLGRPRVALELFWEMDLDGVKPNESTFVNILAACTYMDALEDGDKLYKRAISCGYGADVFVGSTAVTMYSRFGNLVEAKAAFDHLREKSTGSWNAIVRAYIQHGHISQALSLYKEMDVHGAEPDTFTHVCLLGACSSLGALEEGERIHARMGDKPDGLAGSAIVAMYAKCGGIEHAMTAFTKMSSSNVVVWNALIAGYVQGEHWQEALDLYHAMNLEGLEADIYTFSSVLGACSGAKDLSEGRAVHARIVSRGLEVVVPLQNGLVNMFAKCGSLTLALEMFRGMASRNTVSWNSMVTAFCQHGDGGGAFELFKEMLLEGGEPHEQTFTSILNFCSHSACSSLDQGKALHQRITASGVDSDPTVATCLLTMYLLNALAKCGALDDARAVFDGIRGKNVLSWTAMIVGYAQHARGDGALELFREMELDGIQADEITFTSILHACSHRGLVRVGREYFRSMVEDHAIAPSAEHYNVVMDMLARAGRVGEAEEVAKVFPAIKHVALMTLVSSSQVHGVDSSVVARKRLLLQGDGSCEKDTASSYIALSNSFKSFKSL
ncbi:hypothetical protein SELMODRAFT_105356 [Selaginella moellendorffii]|uniref:Pentacotripeptide-repeat region of PRORP domain-containing protein n=1 Tax=Selaginella moellendorffii TaxID=88036 RepID=D8RZG7_SELML|nr:hypothetical protein SELMODRAFT_105356 [Selaginella moellendorffii]